MFLPASTITDKTDLAFFKEQIEVYIRLVECYCELNNFAFQSEEFDIYNELCSIGCVANIADISAIERMLGEDTEKFYTAVRIAVKYREDISPILSKLSNESRKRAQEEAEKQNSLNLVDFFCGAGGLSLGFIQEGFHVRLANDIEDVCIQTYKYNHPELPDDFLIKGDIKYIIDNIDKYINKKIDIVVGGPPCQGFSEANRQRVIDDPRNKLYKYFLKAVEKIAPKFVLMENVKGMLKVAGQVVEDYRNLEPIVNGVKHYYDVHYRILNSQNFSVAQSRERLIYIAVRDDIEEKYSITPQQIFDKIEENCKNNSVYTLADALEMIKPLEAPREKNMNEVDSEITGKKIDVNHYENNDYLNLINNNRRLPFVFNHKARYVSDVNYEIYKRLDQGDDATNEKIADIMPYPHRNHCFKDKYYKLIADRPCRTITAHLKMDCHSHIHPYQVRALTPREAARVQSFPDDYLFWGAYLKTYMQIGNAVPPMMARGIAKVIKEYLE